MKPHEAAQIATVVLLAYPAQAQKLEAEQQDQLAGLYADMFSDLSYEQCNAAVRVLIRTSKFMPSIAEIRSAALELVHGPVAAGGEAWGSVLKAMRGAGANRTPGVDFQFRDPVTARCVNALGWRELCLSENAVADRARFIELYDQLAVEVRREQQAPELAAAHEARVLGGAQNIGEIAHNVVRQLGGGS